MSNFYVFRQKTRKQKFWTVWWQAVPEFNFFLIPSWINSTIIRHRSELKFKFLLYHKISPGMLEVAVPLNLPLLCSLELAAPP
jgi:hypothetical protein